MDELEFAYRYPFSQAAKALVEARAGTSVDPRYLDRAAEHLKDAVEHGFPYTRTSLKDVKYDYLVLYPYSRMLASALRNLQIISAYAAAEAERSAEALYYADDTELLRVSEELGLSLSPQEANEQSMMGFGIRFTQLLAAAASNKQLQLVNQRLRNGAVLLDRNQAILLLSEAIKKSIAKGLPISTKQLPKEVIEHAKHLHIAVQSRSTPNLQSSGASDWIAVLLNIPLPDVRHRAINLVLAPYLVNVRGLPVEEASKLINAYLELCKQLNPDTTINERYVKYQCEYAKRKGTKPLSLSRAKELFSGVIDISVFERSKGAVA